MCGMSFWGQWPPMHPCTTWHMRFVADGTVQWQAGGTHWYCCVHRRLPAAKDCLEGWFPSSTSSAPSQSECGDSSSLLSLTWKPSQSLQLMCPSDTSLQGSSWGAFSLQQASGMCISAERWSKSKMSSPAKTPPQADPASHPATPGCCCCC